MKSKLIKSALYVSLTAGLLTTGTVAAGDPEAGNAKAETCLGCHGSPDAVNVYPTYHVPKIGGQHQAYLVAALKAYRDKTRSHATMHANAAALSDEDIADIAAYFASLK